MADVLIPPSIPTISVGGAVFTDLTNLKCLFGSISGAATSHSGLREPLGATGYVVPAGKKFVCRAINTVAGVAGIFGLGYCDNDLGLESNVSPTNPIYTGNYGYATRPFVTNTGAYTATSFLFEVPAGKYLFINGNASTCSATIQVFGYEVSV